MKTRQDLQGSKIMNRAFGIIVLAGVVAAIAVATSTFSAQSIMLTVVLIASGVLAHGFVISAEKAEFVDEDSDGFVTAVSRFAGMAFRILLGTFVLVCTTVAALWFGGVHA